MAVLDIDIFTPTNVIKTWKIINIGILKGFKFHSKEYSETDHVKRFKFAPSRREVRVEVDLHDDGGVASIPDGGYEAQATSPDAESILLTFILLNKVFSMDKTSAMVDKRGMQAKFERDLKWKGDKAVQAIAAEYSDQFYGLSTGVVAEIKTDPGGSATSHAGVLLKNGFGLTDITDPKYLGRLFRVNERIAAVRAGVLQQFGTVTARNLVTGAIDITWNAAFDPAVNDQFVKANNLENTTLADGTNWNRNLIGLLDQIVSTSVHSLSGASVERWNPAFNKDMASGRLTWLEITRRLDDIEELGGTDGGMIAYVDTGVHRDIIDGERGLRRYTGAETTNLDGDVTKKGLRFFPSHRVPPGMCILSSKNAHHKFDINGRPGAPSMSEAEKIPKRSAFAFPMDFFCALMTLRRQSQGLFKNAQRAA